MKHLPRKRFGQNFLQDQSIINRIIECIDPKPGQIIIEIGPGLAALTKPLIDAVNHIHVVELDRDIIDFLKNNFSKDELIIHPGDALKFDFGEIGPSIRVVGNLPYNISTPLMFYLSQFPNIQNMIFMLQKEVVERICAKPGNKDYGKLTVMLQYKYKCRYLLDVPPESFHPRPKVDSAIISLTPHYDYKEYQVDQNKLNQVVSEAFNQRRKTIANSLSKLIPATKLRECGIDPKLRAENLTINDYITLSKLI